MLLLRGKGRRRGSNTIWSYLVQVREIHHYLVLLMYGVHFCVSHLILTLCCAVLCCAVLCCDVLIIVMLIIVTIYSIIIIIFNSIIMMIIASAPRIPPHQPRSHRISGVASFRELRGFGG